MQDLIKKIEEFRDLVKSLLAKPGQSNLVPALKPPTVRPISMGSGKSTAPTKIPGVTPPSGKDPAKVAQQLKNPRPKKPKMEMLKFNERGQWSLSKAAAANDYEFRDAPNNKLKNAHEYSVHIGGKHIGHAVVEHDGSVGGSVDWDAHPKVSDMVVNHHKGLNRSFKE